MQFDFMTMLGFGVLALAAILVHQHFRGGVVAEEDDLAAGQRQDVLQALKSMRKDERPKNQA